MQHILQINVAKMSRFLRKKRDKTLNVHLPYLYIKCQKYIIFGILYIYFFKIKILQQALYKL